MGGKILQKWGLQPPFNLYNYLRGRVYTKIYFNPLSANPTKWPNTLKQQFVNKLSTNRLSMFDHFVRLTYGDTTQSVWLWKTLAKQVLHFMYIYTIYSVNTGKKQCSTWKHQNTSSDEPCSKFRVQKLHFRISVIYRRSSCLTKQKF